MRYEQGNHTNPVRAGVSSLYPGGGLGIPCRHLHLRRFRPYVHSWIRFGRGDRLHALPGDPGRHPHPSRGISCLLGIILFGTIKGFLYNYIGICLGSLIVFGIAKVYGKPILGILFPQKLIEKYHHLMHEKDRFFTFFTWAIFFPVAPDDFLCYVAGTTEMSWKRFSTVIVLGKPLSIALYSYGLYLLYDQVVTRLFG